MLDLTSQEIQICMNKLMLPRSRNDQGRVRLQYWPQPCKSTNETDGIIFLEFNLSK